MAMTAAEMVKWCWGPSSVNKALASTWTSGQSLRTHVKAGAGLPVPLQTYGRRETPWKHVGTLDWSMYLYQAVSHEQPVSSTVDGEDRTQVCSLTCTQAPSTAWLTSQPDILAKGTGGLRPYPQSYRNHFLTMEKQLFIRWSTAQFL